jgi:hypothetical protein
VSISRARQYKDGVLVIERAENRCTRAYYKAYREVHRERINAAKRAAYDPKARSARHLRYKEQRTP